MSINQSLENLPDEVLNIPNFFECGIADDAKKPRVKWGDSGNLKKFSDIKRVDELLTVGFNIKGTGLMIVDIDHCFNEYGQFVNDKVRMIYCALISAKTYCEKSMSGRGLHFIFKPPIGKFGKIHTSTDLGDGVILEIFYTSENKSIHFTGNVFSCTSKTSPATECDVIQRLLNEVEGKKQYQQSRVDCNDADLIQDLLNHIPCAELCYSDWVNIGMALKSIGCSIETWDNWSKTDSRYKAGECQSKWQGFSDNGAWTIGTLYHFAKQFGYVPPADKNTSETNSVKILEGITAENITREMCLDKKVLRAAALCLETARADLADKFLALAVSANFEGINRRKLEREINRVRKEIKRENSQAKSQKEVADKNKKLQRLKELKAQPKSPERDKEMLQLIRQIVDWSKNPSTGEKINVKATAQNLKWIFDYDPTLEGLFAYNEFANKIVFLKKAKWKHTEQWQDSDDAHLRLYLRETYKELSNNCLIADKVTEQAYKFAFHPVKQYLESLHWDGVHRADEVFIKYLGVEDTEYSRIITRTWLLAAVARIYNAGCRFKWALVLQGAQSIGKSYICETLGGQWMIKLTDSLDDPHAIDDIQEAWIAEIEEWAGGRKAEINAQKSFISRQKDTARLAYERRPADYPRHCVFVVTVNDFAFLRDPTGNSRFKILECRNKKFETGDDFNADIAAQIWAEVMIWYQEMFADGFDEKKLELSKDIELQAEEIAAGFTADDGTADEIFSFVNTLIPPQCIWQLMTKEERRKFFVDASVAFTKSDLLNRYESLSESWKKALVDETELNHAIAIREAFLDNGKMRFYSDVRRQTICAAEIYNECFNGKKPMAKINDALRGLTDWEQVPRLRNTDTQYPDQKKPYARIKNSQSEMPPADEMLPTNGFSESDFEDVVIPDSAVPF